MEKIEKMINHEKENALQNFKQADFETQLAQRIRLASTTEQKKPFFTIMLRRPAFAAAMAAVLLVAVVWLIDIWPPFTTESTRSKIERLVATFPGLHQKIPVDVEKEITRSLTEEEALRIELEWRVKQQFYALSSRDYEKEELVAKVREMFAFDEGYQENQEEEIILTEPVDPVKLNLEKRIKALRQGKKIQLLYQ
jgi:hypothetical protein